jgi:hypothetical protein
MGFRVALLIVFISLIAVCGCPQQVKEAAQTVKVMLESPRMVSGDRTTYSLNSAEWGPYYFQLGLADGRPLVAFRAPDGLRLAVADKGVPESLADWRQFVLDTSPKPLFVRMACEGSSAFVCYRTGSRDDFQWWLASCNDGDPGESGSWSVEELSADLDISLVWSVVVCDGRLGLLYRGQEPRKQFIAWRETSSPGAGWETESPDQLPEEIRIGELLSLDGGPAAGYIAKGSTEVWLASGQDAGTWTCGGILADSENTDLSLVGCSFRSVGPAVGATFLNGEPRTLQYAFTGDATAAQPQWAVTDIVAWGMLGQSDVAFHGQLPVVVFAADTGIFAFIADTPAPAGANDWGMCTLCDDLGELSYNGIEAEAVDGRLISAYIASGKSGSVTLDLTVLDLR